MYERYYPIKNTLESLADELLITGKSRRRLPVLPEERYDPSKRFRQMDSAQYGLLTFQMAWLVNRAEEEGIPLTREPDFRDWDDLGIRSPREAARIRTWEVGTKFADDTYGLYRLLVEAPRGRGIAPRDYRHLLNFTLFSDTEEFYFDFKEYPSGEVWCATEMYFKERAGDVETRLIYRPRARLLNKLRERDSKIMSYFFQEVVRLDVWESARE